MVSHSTEQRHDSIWKPESALLVFRPHKQLYLNTPPFLLFIYLIFFFRAITTTVFVPPANNIKIENNEIKTKLASENIDKGKSILGAPPKLKEKDVKNPRAKKANSQKPKQKKQHLCHHCEATEHTQPNCYKWLATQQSNSMISSTRINFHPPLLLFKIFSKSSYSF